MNLLKIATSFCIAVCFFSISPLVVGLGITADYRDDVVAGEGFWDPVVGAQRRAAFEHAMSIWAAHLDGTIPLKVQAEFNNLDPGVLGLSTVIAGFANLPGFPEPGWVFVGPLASQLNDNDRSDSFGNHMFVEFNTDFDAVPSGSGKWYYGTDGLVPSGDNDLVTAALHEMGHGLGMIGNVNSGTGAYSGIPHYFLFFAVQRGSTNLFFDDMSNVQRLAAITSGEVYFSGPNIIAANIPNPSNIPDPSNPLVNAAGEAKLYTPSPWESGSLSHWDKYHFPDVRTMLMKSGPVHPVLNIGYTKELLKDLGWTFNLTPEIEVIPDSLSFDGTNINAGPSSALTVTMTNTGSVDLQLIDISLDFSDADQFQITGGSTPGALSPLQTRDVTLVFDPDSNGGKSSFLRIYSNDTHQWSELIVLLGNAFDGTATTAWVDFDFVGDEMGTETAPFDTLAEGLGFVMAGGTVNIQPGTTPETITIDKAVILINIGAARGGSGVVRIGDPLARSSKSFDSERDTGPASSGFISSQRR